MTGNSGEAIEAALRKRAGAAGMRGWCAIALGAGLTLIGPFVMAMLVWAIALLGFYRWLPFGWMFLGISVVFVPILYWYAARGSENMLTEALEGGSSESAAGLWAISHMIGGGIGQMAALGAVAAQPRAAAAGFQEIFLWGPRMVVQAMRTFRAASKLRAVDVKEAARVLGELLRNGRGMAIENLNPTRRVNDSLIQSLAYLVFHDWVGLSADGKRAWALTAAKQHFGLKT